MSAATGSRENVMKFGALFASVLVTVSPKPAFAQDPRHGVREFTESGTWRVPAGVTHIIVELWGAGGGGAGGGSTIVGGTPAPGGGGGAGAYVRASMSVTEGETYHVAVGAGGTGGEGRSEPGADGAPTTLGRNGKVLLFAPGGRGGGVADGPKGGKGGAGGVAERGATILVRPGNSGSSGLQGVSAESDATAGGTGGSAIVGTIQPPGSFGGAGGSGVHSGESKRKPGGSGSVLITW